MEYNLFKNVSAAQIEAAIAKTLTDLIGQEGTEIQVNVSGLDFESGAKYATTRVAFSVQAQQTWNTSDDELF